ncbi:BMP family ABC transporter substrate-binding protein [Desulfosporosinus sp. BG]|uniref:BMP family ABC transporter substrate-binding protein n=1 Tax=Desulfosporosinus sp. BG TaxID=1633135 RepID=UPI00083A241F|nr:BMP family ABC transporter substrate-binding protein [Desulfosporosinus sp. BG]ODA40336.1 Nucleoside ABC transporter, periplasmic nucleoside-binding protein [Desulfosporosinus sp. BG]
MKKINKIGVLTLVLAMILSVLLSGCSQASKPSTNEQASKPATEEKIKVAFVYVGPVGDFGYTYAQDQGRKYLESQMKNVETTYVENVPETADAERVFTDLAQKGNKIIIGTSYGYMDYMVNVSKKFPDVVFEHCSGYKATANLGTYFNRDYQARYLTGMVAGKYTKSNVLGFLAPFGTPEVIRNIDAFTLGAQSINPKVQVKVVWTNSWNDPATEKTAANSLIDAGADVLAMHVDSPTFAQTAQDRGVLAVGHDSDMSKFAPNSILVGDVSNWGPYFVQVVKEVMAKTWKSTQYFGGIKDGGIIDITPFSDKVDKDFQATVTAKKQDIMDGKFDPFSGPIYDQSGTLKVKEGDKAPDNVLLSINWFVKGVSGSIPKS